MIGKRFSSDDEVLARLRRLEHRVDAVQLGTGTTNVTNITETGVENFVELGDVPQTFVGATGEFPYVNAAEDGLDFNPYVTVSPTVPILTVRNLTDAEVDCVHQYAIGASPVVKWTHGLDDSDGDKWKLAVGDEFGDAHDTIVVTSGEGSTPGVAEFTLISTFDTPESGSVWGGCSDGPYVYYGMLLSADYTSRIIKIDPVTGVEITRSFDAQTWNSRHFAGCATEGAYVYVGVSQTGSIWKYACSDLAYIGQSANIGAHTYSMCYRSGYLYVAATDARHIHKIRCSDLAVIWSIDLPVGSGAQGIATDGQYIYVGDFVNGGNNQIDRLDMDGAWVDATAVANPLASTYAATWCAGDFLYNIANYSGTRRVEKRNKSDLSVDSTFILGANYIATQGFQSGDYHWIIDRYLNHINKYQYTTSPASATAGIQFRLKDAYGIFFDVAKLTAAGRFGVGTTIPSETIEAVGNIKATAGQFISTKATGTAPHVVSSTTVCTNLNAGLVDGYHHDQSLLTTAAPAFDHLHLSATSNQIVLQSAGVTGTITATPASSNKVWTLQDVTGTIYQTGGTDVAVADGGTGLSSYAVGDILYASAGTTLAGLPDVAVGSYLRSGGVTTAPLWSTLILPNAATAYRLPVATSANTIGELAAVGATGEYLKGNTGAIPSWATLNQAAVPGLTTADHPTFDYVDVGDKAIKTNARMKAYLGTNQLDLVDTVPTVVLLDTEAFDSGSDFDTGTHRYTVPVTGYYLVVGNVNFTNVIADKGYYSFIAVDGVRVSRSQHHSGNYTTYGVSVCVTDFLYMVAGSYVELQASVQCGANTVDINSGGGSQAYTYLSIHLMSIA